MDWAAFEQIINSISSIVTILAIIVGGIWAYLRFIRQVEYFPHIEFEVDIRFVGLHKFEWLVELQALINNKGVVRHEIRDFQFDLRCLKRSDDLQDGNEQINYQAFIPHVLREGYWLPPNWENTLVDPGVSTHYSYVTRVPNDATFLLLHGRFHYKDEKYYHTADKLVKVPNQDSS